MQLIVIMWKFEANRCGFRDAMPENRPFGTLTFFKLNTDFFQKILYWNSAKDNNMQLMCKFEANRCDFHNAMIENRPFGALSFWTVIAFVFQTQRRFFPKNLILEFSKK